MQENPLIIHRKRTGSVSDPLVSKNESLKLDSNGKVILSELPNKFAKVKTTGDSKTWYEIKSGIPDSNQFKVDYDLKSVTFNISNAGKQLNFEYMGEGLSFISVDNIYVTEEDGVVTDTLATLTTSTKEARDTTNTKNIEIQTAETVRISSENTRNTNETNRQNSESTRSSSEGTRVISENNRVTAETGRVTAESLRVSQENTRVNQETTRTTAETARVSAETTRQNQESTRQSQETTRQTNTTNTINSLNTLISDTKFTEPYNSTTTYSKNNIVSYNGSSYIAKQTTIGNTPPDGTSNAYWGLLAQKGVDGTGVATVNGQSGTVVLSAIDVGAAPSSHQTDTVLHATYATNISGADDYSITVPNITNYIEGMVINFKATVANTADATLNINSLGAKNIYKNTTAPLESGDIVINQIISVIYNGTSFQLLSMLGAVTTANGSQTLANKTLASPRIADGGSINDGNGNEQIKFKQTASAVNEFTVKNNIAGSAPELQASGNDTNIDINLVPKGIGVVKVNGNQVATLSDIPDASTTVKGITILEDSITSTSTTKAATPNSVKTVNDALATHKADGTAHGVDTKASKLGDTFTGVVKFSYGIDVEASSVPTAKKGAIYTNGATGDVYYHDLNGWRDIWHDGNNPASVAANGYQKYRNGLIFQWGTTVGIAPNTLSNITFPIVFPNGCKVVVATVESNTPSVAVVSSLSTNICGVIHNDSVTRNIKWIAIGY